jgi:hypothetical protein
MTIDSAHNAKLLFVLSNDYGELSNALYLVKGQGFQTTLLMPQRLFAINQGTLTIPAYPYTSPLDVLDAVSRESPDIVFLFSGYLYAINNLFGGLDAVVRLIQDLRAGPRRIVTSDPFLGILGQLGPTTFSDNHPLRHWLLEHFRRVVPMLEGVTHLYLVPPNELAVPRSVSFFNANVIEDGPGLDAWRSKAALLHPNPSPPARGGQEGGVARKRWLFVLSLEDYGKQTAQLGRARFDSILLRKLQEAIRASRQAVLVAPKECIESVARIGPLGDALLLHFCGYEKFQAFLFDAEYVFYWNLFSNSIMPRVVNRLPVFLFDQGHLAHAIPALLEAAIRHYYVSAKLPYLDQQRDLAEEKLTSMAALQQIDLEPARAHFHASQNPVEMVQLLLQG